MVEIIQVATRSRLHRAVNVVSLFGLRQAYDISSILHYKSALRNELQCSHAVVFHWMLENLSKSIPKKCKGTWDSALKQTVPAAEMLQNSTG